MSTGERRRSAKARHRIIARAAAQMTSARLLRPAARPGRARRARRAGPARAGTALRPADHDRHAAPRRARLGGRAQRARPRSTRSRPRASGFPTAVSPAPLTLPAHTSLFTGLFPRRHGVRDNGQVLGAGRRPTLAERLAARGYATAAFVSGYPLRAPFGLDRGFARYDDALPTGGRGLARAARAADDGRGARVAARRRAGRSSSGCTTTTRTTRTIRPRAFRGARAARRVRRRGGVRRPRDRRPARGPRRARSSGPPSPCSPPTTARASASTASDAHGFFLYDTTVTVPLVVHFPGRVAPGRERRARCGSSTSRRRVLDARGAAPPLPDVDGVSLVPLLDGAPPATRSPRSSRRSTRGLTYGWSPLSAVRHGGPEARARAARELYDLARDPARSATSRSARPADVGAAARRCSRASKRGPAAPSRPSRRPAVARAPARARLRRGRGPPAGRAAGERCRTRRTGCATRDALVARPRRCCARATSRERSRASTRCSQPSRRTASRCCARASRC